MNITQQSIPRFQQKVLSSRINPVATVANSINHIKTGLYFVQIYNLSIFHFFISYFFNLIINIWLIILNNLWKLFI